jgi:DHA2 family multidrug resistance protein
MAPISAIAMVGIAAAEAGAASGLSNMIHNLGGTIGIAAIETFSRREQFHYQAVEEVISR